MIRALILYYLSLKPTHGYEIQKYIQINHMDSWTKIQSGSIYYALGKLEKEGLITLYREENIGSKVRKIYCITDKGKEELKASVKEEIKRQIYDVGSDKFIVYPILQGLDKETIIAEVSGHIDNLKKQKQEQEKWQRVKVNKESLGVERLCFEMMISSLEYQIKWHETLIEEIDKCLEVSSQMANLIKHVDFSTINDISEIKDSQQEATLTSQDEIAALKKAILECPDKAAEKLEELIHLIKES